jgi:glycosyltransferase involved in cell wall biosynthesis
VYIGSFSWEPNVDAAIFLARDVLPRIRAVEPDVRLQIVGKDPPPQLMAMRQIAGVEVTGTVPSIVPYLERASVLAVPLSVGGGTRLKILEALAGGLPVVSTAVGAEGLDVVPEVHLRLAERPAFADAVIGLLQQRHVAGRLAAAGRELVRRRYDWKSIGAVACDMNEKLAAAKRTDRP